MQYSIENDILRLTVDSHGAEPVSVIHKPTGAELLWQADPAVWNRHAPILFPYTGKLTGGKMLAKGVEYARRCPSGRMPSCCAPPSRWRGRPSTTR